MTNHPSPPREETSSEPSAVNGALPGAAQTRQMEPAEPIYDGEVVDGSPGRKAVLAGSRTLTWTMDPQVLVEAFRDAKLIDKDESLRLFERAARVGDGWAITVDLPVTRKAADVIKHRDALASALAVDEVQLIIERVRGKGGHAGRVFLWVADEDPYSGPPLRTPLLDVECWDAWRPVPFGRDARHRRIDLSLVWTSLLVGVIPRQGKTFAIRLPAAGLILDPYTRLYCVRRQGRKGLGRRRAGGLPVRARRRPRPRRA